MSKTRRDVERGAPRRRPPPNYFSRRVQLRLLVLVAMLMSVVVLIPHAADPDNYAWMFGKQGATDPGGDGSDNGEPQLEPDTRVSPENLATDPAERRPVEVTPESLTADEPRDALYLAGKDAWNELLADMTRDQRDLLARAMRSLRHGESLSADDRTAWRQMVDRFDEGWRQHLAQARDSLAALPADQRVAWGGLLDRLERQWNEQRRPALLAALEDRPPTTGAAAQIGELQSLFDRLALARVVDDKPYQAVERDAWFRLLEMLRYTDLEQLEQQSIGEVGYLQLFRQSQEYRGKLVTIRGQAKQAYRVPAPPNDFGIEAYHVYWIRPEGGVNSPVAVYALASPEGFPEAGPQSGAATSMNEDVEITGFFLKRWAYPAKDGPRTAPLMLAKVPRWNRASSEAESWLSPLVTVGLCALGAIVVAAGVTFMAFRFGRKKSGFRMPSLYTARPEELKALENVKTTPSIEQSLQQLAHGKDHNAPHS